MMADMGQPHRRRVCVISSLNFDQIKTEYACLFDDPELAVSPTKEGADFFLIDLTHPIERLRYEIDNQLSRRRELLYKPILLLSKGGGAEKKAPIKDLERDLNIQLPVYDETEISGALGWFSRFLFPPPTYDDLRREEERERLLRRFALASLKGES